MGKLAGKVALITGGARGQGRSHAVRLAEEGAQIIICDIAEDMTSVPYPLATDDDLAETVALVESLDTRCLAVKADARSVADMGAVVERGVAEFGRIDIVSVNHGICVPTRWDAPEETVQDILDTNLKGALFACQAAIPQLIEQGEGGAIVLTSSAAGIGATKGLLVYAMAKHGVIGLMRGLAVELASHRIRVNAICPGTVDTPMVMNDAVLSMFSGIRTGGTKQSAEFAARSLTVLPEPWLEARDISNALCFLVSDEARYVTGIAMPVDLGTANQPAGIPSVASEALVASRGY